jgi:hypothetical protein
LESGDKRLTLLGLFAATELQERGVLDLAIDLCDHCDSRVAAAALRLRDLLFEDGIALTRRILAKNHGIAEAFALLSGIELRRQTLRWTGSDNRETNASIDQILAAALGDADAEVRITAVLVAAKLNARKVIEPLRRTRVPESARDGAPEKHRLFYREIHRAAVRYLTTGTATASFAQFVTGSLQVKDDPTLLLHSLTTPVDLGAKPAHLPDGVERFENGYRLQKSGITLRWVGPIEHWIGEDGQPASPVRTETPAAGFFISERVLTEACGYQQALGRCEILSRREGARIVLPTADQWEMAARGPDGRRYPWGNSMIGDWNQHASPWGLRETVGYGFEWTRTLDGNPLVCGSIELSSCSKRTDARHTESARLRPVLEHN